jgi:hypothetical protein
MMHHPLRASVLVVALLFAPARAGDEPKLAGTDERLTADEENAARKAVYAGGPTTAGGFGPGKARVLLVPAKLQDLYEAKPRATARLLLKVVEVGRAGDSVHAACCIQALVWGPEYAAITARGANADKWDEVIGGTNPLTFREHARQVCVKLIARKEGDDGAGKKK